MTEPQIRALKQYPDEWTATWEIGAVVVRRNTRDALLRRGYIERGNGDNGGFGHEMRRTATGRVALERADAARGGGGVKA